MRVASYVIPILLASALASGAAAQERTRERPISGTVTDSTSGAPISGALVTVRGVRTGALTRENGTFVVTAPLGDVTLLVRSIGYRSKEVRVGANQSQVTIALARDVFRLEEIVVSGQATGVERLRLANAVATVRASDLGSVPTASIEQQLQGKVAGADIQTNSGAPGGGAQIRLRGITSVNADAQPLYVVDGVIVSDVAIPSNQNEVTAASGGSNPALTQDAQVNRIADLNPDDIESIEILKGASASAIYGGRASNGVVIITTHRGQVGAPRITVSQRFGVFALSNKLGSRHFRDVADVDSTYGAGTAASIGWTPGTFYDLEQQLAGRHDLSTETQVSVSGGNEATQYFVSGVWKDDAGIIANTGFQRQGLRLNLDQRLSRRMNASVSTDLLHTRAQRGLTNNDNSTTSFYMVLPFTPAIVDLDRCTSSNATCTALGVPAGTFPPNTFVGGSNPVQTAALMRNNEDVWRFIGAGRLTWDLRQTATGSLRLIGNGGVDYFNQVNDLFFPPELYFEPQDGLPGTSLLSNSNSTNLNLGWNLVHTYTPAGGRFAATTSVGFQYARRQLPVSRIAARNLIGGQSNVDAGTNIRVRENRSLIKNRGMFLQEELLTMRERLFLTFGIRADASSLNADAGKYYYYPKLSASYRWMNTFGFNELKLRGAYGESGNEPLYGQRFSPLDATQNIGGLAGIVVRGTTGARDLRPERQREIEIGTDATFLHERASLEFSWYQKNIGDLLLQRTLAPSSGFSTVIFNGADSRLRTGGVELSLSLIPAQRTGFQWFFRTTFSRTRSTITKLEVPPFLTGGFGTSLGAFRIEEGASATQIVGNDTLPDGSIVVRKIGDATPDFRMSFTNDVTWHSLNLHILADWQQGSSILNLTRLLYDFGQVTVDYADPYGPGETVGQHRLAGFRKVAANYMESASFLKLREVTLSYDLPTAWAQRLWGGVHSARFSVSGRNLLTFTPYTGLDPEVSNFGNQPVTRNIDVAPFPPSRSFWFSLNLGF